MKKIFYFSFVFFMLTINVYSDTSVQGELKSDINAKIKNGDYIYNEENLLIKYKADLSDSVASFASMEFRYQNFPEINKVSDLNDRNKVEPLEIQLKEAYIDYYGFLLDNIDIRIGKQRIAWGTADKMNPTDNINPDDLTRIFDFGEKIPTIAFKSVFYINDDFSLQAVWLPFFTPVKFSDNMFNFSDLINEKLIENIRSGISSFGVSPAVSVTGSSVDVPETKTKNAMYAAKFSGKVLNFDFSLSYFKGYDDMPIMDSVTVDATGILAGNVTASYKMRYPKLQVIGVDTSGEIFSIGVWAEAACFIPEEVKYPFVFKLPVLLGGTSVNTNTALDAEPYFKYTIGFDYTFKNGLYFNTQFVHGFFTERGYHDEKPQDYIISRIEKKFFDDKLKLGLNGSLEIYNLNKAESFSDIKENSGNMWGPDITYYPADNIELSTGCIVIQGNEKTFFGNLQDYDNIYIRGKLYF